jgi:hypothetical protein
MSNYPPGVTGNEYEIAGGNEFEEWFECRNTTTYIHITKHEMHQLADHALSLFNEFKRTGSIGQHRVDQDLIPLLRDLNSYCTSWEVYESDCNFSGVTVKEEYRGTVMVNCPKCNHDSSYEID